MILQHSREAKHPFNTARIAQLCLEQCTTVAISDNEEDETLADLIGASGEKLVLVYPGADSRPLQELDVTPATSLLFIDASWRKSRRILLQSPSLQNLPRFALPKAGVSRYRIRREPRADYYSTLEAIATALQMLDDTDVANMLEVMDWMIARQLAAMR